MMHRRTISAFSLALRGLAVAVFAWAGVVFTASAALAPAPCDHNVCTDSFVVGGQNVAFSYTQHVRPGGQLRVRIFGGTYDTTGLISYIIYNLPRFDAWSVLPNTAAGAVALPGEDVNPGQTAFERSDSDGCSGCFVDMVMAVDLPPGQAPGAYTFSLNVIQFGESAGRSALPFYVDAAAPTNRDESDVFNTVVGPTVYVQDMDEPCADREPPAAGAPFDNDLNYLANCADPDCDGSIGSFSPFATCQLTEITCNDGFDNDGDGSADCADPDCDGRLGSTLPQIGFCQHGNEYDRVYADDPEQGLPDVGFVQTCQDDFDNDGDGRMDCADNSTGAQSCWKQPAYGCPATEISCVNGVDDDADQSYSDAWDDVPTTGIDCTDYDCRGNDACPKFEHRNAFGDAVDGQCFDTFDNDLDGRVDCQDIDDCFGVRNPANIDQTCLEFEFSLVQKIQYCANSFDDDGDDVPGPPPADNTDCSDADCRRAFGSCGPCPSREDITYDACADGADNDADGGLDCADPDGDCVGGAYLKLGSMGGTQVLGSYASAAHCAVAESTNGLCSDRFDNDADTAIDCQDIDCAGLAGPDGQFCEPGGETQVCNDGLDNDLDGYIDCADTDCFGEDSCALQDWTNATCVDLEQWSGPRSFTGTDPTIAIDMMVRQHVGQVWDINLTGNDAYTSVTVIVGDNTDSALYFPFADATCEILPGGINEDMFGFTSGAGRYLQIFNDVPGTVNVFDLTIRCTTPGAPLAYADLPVSLSALKTSGIPEYGDLMLFTELMEDTDPSVLEIEPEGLVGGEITVRRGSRFGYRVVPQDPGTGLDTSGICRCWVRVNGGSTYASGTPGGDCVITPTTLYTDDTAVSVEGRTEDGADNTSAWTGASAFSVNVLPIVTVPTLISTPSTPFIRSGDNGVAISASFQTGDSDTFGLDCEVHAYRPDGSEVPGPIDTFPSLSGGLSNVSACSGSITPDFSGAGDGEYFLTLQVRDSDGDWIESDKQPIYWCDATPGGFDPESPCSKADFDRDGATEGMYTTLYSSSPRACDNCIGMVNPDQTDTDANGIGEQCEPGEIGRCEVDRNLVCDCGAPPDFTSPNATAGPLRDPDDPLNKGLDETFYTPGTGCAIFCPASSYAVDPAADLDDIDPAVHEADGRKIEQRCVEDWGVCLSNGEICFSDLECTGSDGLGFGTCDGDGVTQCKRETDCYNAGVDGPCTGADICTNLLFPWLETQGSNIYSGFKIIAPEEPPRNNVNATFCITARDTILNFRSGSQECQPETVPSLPYEIPKPSNAYRTVLGNLDVDGLRAGRYGAVQTFTDWTDIPSVLDGGVYLHDGDLVIGDPALGPGTDPGAPFEINNGTGALRGHGTIIVNGGDLIINKDIVYDGNTIADLRHLASIAWIVLDDGSGTKGNLYVHRLVNDIAGVFYVDGPDPGVQFHNADQFPSDEPLTVRGLMIARKFILSRAHKSFDRGAEQILYDGRAVVNPPPGFSDLGKILPQFTQSTF